MNDDFDEQDLELIDQLGIDDATFMMQDEDGIFDMRKQPARALVAIDSAAKYQATTIDVLTQALVQLMADGHKVVVKVPQLHSAVTVVRHHDHLHLLDAQQTDHEPANSLANVSGGTYAERVANLHNQIYTDNYYVDLFQNALQEHDMTSIGIENHQYSQAALNNMLNHFWFSLPDSQTIRTGPFFFLCDLCEEGPDV